MAAWVRAHAKKLLIVPPLVIGLAILVAVIGSGEGPRQSPPHEAARKVRVIAVPTVALVPRALGYGSVRPEFVWEAVAEVGGQVVETHPQLKKGAILGKGEVLLRIDPEHYELAAAEAEANIRVVEA